MTAAGATAASAMSITERYEEIAAATPSVPHDTGSGSVGSSFVSELGHPTRPVSLSGIFLGHYMDPVSGLRVVISRPAQQPELWSRFFRGARDVYRTFGAEKALDWQQNASGQTTNFFFAVLDAAGHVVAGSRVQGPYVSAESAHVLSEWSGHPGAAEVRSEIDRRLGAGVIEMKTGWVHPDVEDHSALSAVVARTPLHAAAFLDIRYALCSLHVRVAKRWLSTGGVISSAVTPVEYPNERYQTVLMWWDRFTSAETAEPDQIRLLQEESEQWRRWPGRRSA